MVKPLRTTTILYHFNYMGVIEQRDDYTDDSHNVMIQQHVDQLYADGFEVTDIVRVQRGIWLLRKNYTKIYYRKRRDEA